MAGPERYDAFQLMRAFCSDERRLNDALTLFVEREDYGFVWLAYLEDALVGCATVGFTIGTTAGGIVAHVGDLYVLPDARRGGVATALLETLTARVTLRDVVRVTITADDPSVRAFVLARGFVASDAHAFSRDR